ncbi:MAG: C_GCAxxG_C_C family protein [Dehalococcoidia bacterium]|nr:C_GCAxxG_C_C family protein [Dehalococcoidia bacterium]
MSDEGLREETLNQLEERAGDYEERSGCCAQGCLLALQEQFHLGDELTFKAATAMPGIALRGETCGAVIGGLMAIGLAYGRESLDDWEGFLRAIRPARRFCRRFEKEFGSMMCRDIVKLQCGRSFDLADPAESREFEESAGYQKCRVPPGKAARIAGEIIMEKENPTSPPSGQSFVEDSLVLAGFCVSSCVQSSNSTTTSQYGSPAGSILVMRGFLTLTPRASKVPSSIASRSMLHT